MDVSQFFKSVREILSYSRKSSWKELSAYLKLFLLALFLIGGIGIIMHLVAFWLSLR
ncbi:MAG: hypothetical protein ACP5LF_05140 [Nitrososphaeria archaeon]|nr:preprotein translocase subunit SecE [Conexivisphaerales archaeon]